MNIVIIEDEELTAEDLKDSIIKVEPEANILVTLHSVKEALSFFRKNSAPDLIFCDVQLGDGLSFEIFQQSPINTPVIFCTAYDEYALDAFRSNGIDYILKPFTIQSIREALNRYKRLKGQFSPEISDFVKISALFGKNLNRENTSILIHIKDKIIPVKLKDIALFFVENEINYLCTFDQKFHALNKTMEELEKLAGNQFYRANRKFLVNRSAIKDVSRYFNRKLLINLTISVKKDQEITVAKTKASDFISWFESN